MVSNAFRIGMILRIAALFLTLALAAWMSVHTEWYLSITLCIVAAIAQAAMMLQFSTRSVREITRLLDAIAVDDTSQLSARPIADSADLELRTATARVAERLRSGRFEREQHALYLQALLSHVPVALVCIQGNDFQEVQLLNLAARRLFETPVSEIAHFARYGDRFAADIMALDTGSAVILRLERSSGSLMVKAAVTEMTVGGVRRRLISLQNIDNELNAQELEAWQKMIRVLAHEVMNSLTPITSLATTSRELVSEASARLPEDHVSKPALTDAREALETITRRNEGLLEFVRKHHHLTRRMSASPAATRVHDVFGRLRTLLLADLASRNITLQEAVEPESLEVMADPDLLDQALINLVRNSVDALRGTASGVITMDARRDRAGRVVISVADNGAGIPADMRDRIFVPFFTTKRQGSGVGLTIVRRVAVAHGASVEVLQTPGGGATFSLRF